MAQITVREFIDEVRDDIGDDTHTYPTKLILSWLNTALRELASQLNHFSPFNLEDSIELADFTESGQQATQWRLDDDSVGDILRLREIYLTSDSTREECSLPLTYLNNQFFKAVVHKPCSPCEDCICMCDNAFTITKNLKGTFLKTQKPLPSGTIAHITYEFIPKRYKLENVDEVLPINLILMNLLLKLVRVNYHRYNVDDTRAVAEYENIDKEIYELKNNLALDHSDFTIKRSW